MTVKCIACSTKFEAHPAPYPKLGHQTKHHDPAGDRFIECPTCARRYFFYAETDKWSSDRDLVIILGSYRARKVELTVMPTQTIELDCPPGPLRPDALIGGVIEGTGLPLKEPTTMWFGNYTWDYSEVPSTKWKVAQDTTKPRIIALHNSGLIRYGSW